jgi:hypothetical protein
MKKPLAFYQLRLEEYSAGLSRLTTTIRRFAWYRFIAFILIFVPIIVWGISWLSGAISIFFLVLFFYLIKSNIDLERQRIRTAVLKKITEHELLALDHQFLHFQNGKEFLDVEHFYAYDLDLFGEGSVFQFLNRTSTYGGKNRLADWLMHPLKNPKEIRKKQDAVAELSRIPEWRLEFLADGNLFDESEQLNTELMAWSETRLELGHAEVKKWLMRLIPVLTVLSLVPAVLGISNLFITFFILVQWALMSVFWKSIAYYFKFFGRKSDLLAKYTSLLSRIELAGFQS